MDGKVFKGIKGLLGPPIDLQTLNLIIKGQLLDLVWPCLIVLCHLETHLVVYIHDKVTFHWRGV